MPYPARVTIPERIADLARDLPPEKQAEVLEFVEQLRSGRPPPAARRGSLDALHVVLKAAPVLDEIEPEWSPFKIEPVQTGLDGEEYVGLPRPSSRLPIGDGDGDG
jgi:hypothetical protein